MLKSDNICKFIDSNEERPIYTINFVYEKNPSFLKSISPKNNAIYLVTNGSGLITINKQKNEISTGDIFFTFKNTPFNLEIGQGLEYIYITFNGSRSDELFTRFAISPTNFILKNFDSLIPLWQNSIVKAGEKNIDLISEAVLLYTLGELAPLEKNSNDFLIETILKQIKENFSDSSLNLTKLSKDLGYNSKYISRIFREKTKITFSEYLTNTRIQHAMFLMDHGITAIKNVALLSGYKDAFYFSNVFKNIVGISPSEYIKNHSN